MSRTVAQDPVNSSSFIAKIFTIEFLRMSANPEAATALIDKEAAWAHRLAHLLWDVTARVAMLGESELSGTPLTLASLGLLDVIAGQPGTTVADIARQMPRTQQSVSQTMKRLEKLGYVERRLGPRRGIGLHLTATGERTYREASAHETLFDQRLTELFGVELHDKLGVVFEQARKTLTEDSRPPKSLG
jgi:DNA-binding MarR family transcriptional regulator